MIKGKTYTVHIGNNLDILPTMPDNSVDSIVTDPPYELGFMGKKWDSSGIAYSVELWRECLRVLKPGGHLLSFGGTRTWHRVAVGIEDAGFEVRDSIAWMYGSGFPKSLDVSKAIDKSAGAEREVIDTVVSPFKIDNGAAEAEYSFMHGTTTMNEKGYRTTEITAPSTPEAKQWEGWGTALKPAFEPIVVARKPLIGTVAENVLTHGTGALNIDGSRIGISDEDRQKINNMGGFGSEGFVNTTSPSYNTNNPDNPLIRTQAKAHSQGRWPANVILDEYSAGVLDEQSDASRFYYVAKASKRDRNEGLEKLDDTTAGNMVEREEGSAGMNSPRAGAGRTSGAKNFHPTVKPTQLMRYLVKLVTPPGGTVLDPFTGSGSTGKAAILEGFTFIGCELTEDYIPIIEGRLKHAEQMASEAKDKEDEALF
jgi:site-specific DNA-methyltransferase (adenine-specific)